MSKKTVEVFDSSVFVEAILGTKRGKRARTEIYRVKSAPNRQPALTHEALGEILDVLLRKKLFANEQERDDAFFNFCQLYNEDDFILLTPLPKEVSKVINELVKTDRVLEESCNDCLFLAKAIAEDVDKVYTLDKKWIVKSLVKIVEI